MRKKVLAVVSALVITTLAFTGCGSNKSASSDNGSDSGAKSQAITVVSREEGSGTRGAFVELLGVVDENENDITVSSAQITNSTSVMLQKVAQTKSAIGYVSLGSLSTDVKAVQVDGVDATAENVKSGDYKVSRPFNICYKEDKLSDIDKDFISFIMSKEGQQIVNDKPAIVTDTHCIRLVNRMGLVDNIKEPKKVEMALWKIIPPEEGSDFCHRLVYHGREICTARTAPHCDRCCLNDVCKKNIK